MNKDHQIYRDLAENIPPEDTARLDGFLAAKADETELSHLKAEVAALKASYAEAMSTSIKSKIN